MSFPVLNKYLAILSHTPGNETSVWLDAQGRAQGKYFNCTLTSVFQPIRVLDSTQIIGYEAFARSYSENDAGLSLWKILDHAASDDESVELDRLCRMLHAINFFRQPEAVDADLYLAVHDRLLAAVSTNHGIAFRRILEGLGLPINKIVLQLPAVTEHQGWLLSYVADNYRRNGFRFAVNVSNAAEALALLTRIRPDVIKVDAREIVPMAANLKLLEVAQQRGIQVIFKRLETLKALEALRHLNESDGQAIYTQGHLWDIPDPSLAVVSVPYTITEVV
ncbi:MAG TPA: EAL domain-containing protein [Burkholderiaceae bacterium]|jgi:EAL domain-containing protein (putative c-di-GMP-specific phosphodiesterase class I)